MPTSVEEHRFRGEPAITLRAGDLRATFLPELGMTGVSLRQGGREHLALPGGLDALRRGKTLGLPLLAPWANRLAARAYRVGRHHVDLRRLALPTDANGLPIHGFLVGRRGWRVVRHRARGGSATVRAALEVDTAAFPFPHRIQLDVAIRDGQLRVDTTVIATGRRRVPVSFGWHPYLRLPGTPRSRWRLRLPSRRHLLLDARGIPTGESRREAVEDAPIGRRRADDLYALGRDRRLALASEDGSTIELHGGLQYPFAQVWIPPGRRFAALEPMTAPTNALVDGTTPLVPPGESYRARYSLTVHTPST